MADPEERQARQDISEVLIRYATGIDARNWELFRSCFTEDCHADYGDIGVWAGVDAIADYMAVTHADMGHTLHRISNAAIEVDGDTAASRSYVDAVLMSADGDSGVNAIGFYDDELVRSEGGWKIARRRFTMARVEMLGATSPPAQP